MPIPIGHRVEFDYSHVMSSVQQFGEPGFVWSEDEDALFNPCVEIGLYAKLPTKVNKRITLTTSGWQACNLCEINMRLATTDDAFSEACRIAAVIGTLQAHTPTFRTLGT